MTTSQLTSLIPFLLRAKKATYAASDDPAQLEKAKCPSSRPNSHDLAYSEGNLYYYDTYLGGFAFSGEEAVWQDKTPLWSMNYYGTMLVPEIPDGFGGFLKLAMRNVDEASPYRGPKYFAHGRWNYECHWEGDFSCYHGEEIIKLDGKPVYRLYFHGGAIL